LLTLARLPASTLGDALYLDGPNVAALFELRSPHSGFAAVNAPPEHGSPDEVLVRAAQLGDRSAFGLLYARYARMVHGILLSRVPYSDVDDLVQDVFLQALPRLHSLREVSKFPGWLASIARNRASDFHRRAKPHDELHEDSPSAEANQQNSLSLPPASHSSAEARAVLDAIRSLPEAYREPLILRLVEGLTGPEIAARIGLTHGSVRVNLHRGMQQLREILARKAAPLTGGEL
jgi:RNA polymerase sigma-70 factor (ECF subfamily)